VGWNAIKADIARTVPCFVIDEATGTAQVV
jgi:hypothetical protein